MIMATLYWLQAGGCGGDTMSLLNAESPNVIEEFDSLGIEILWHPSLSCIPAPEHETLIESIVNKKTTLDILCIEGAVIQGPDSTGLYDQTLGKPKMDLVKELAKHAGIVIAIGTCASFGGVTSLGEVEGTGVQFLKQNKGGLLGSDFRSHEGFPVVNLSGCPCHPQVILGMLATYIRGAPIIFNGYNMPMEWYNTLVHQGCTKNEYHEFRVEEVDFGEKGCLFFHLGCHGPLTYGPCNKILWNRRNCKTRAGVPCFGCTGPDFPQAAPFFQTKNIEGVPLELPEGMSRAHYLAYKSMAAAAAPERLKRRETET
jgi:NiFe hydrogenase small subunit HydA